MEQRRFILFLTLSMALLFGWQIVGPKLFPGLFPKPRPAVKKEVAPDAKAKKPPQHAEVANADKAAGDRKDAPAVEKAEPGEQPVSPDDKAADKDAEPQTAHSLPQHPLKKVELGSLDLASGYFMQVSLSTSGASLTEIALNDPRYRELDKPDQPLRIVGHDPLADVRTFDLSVHQVDGQLQQHNSSLQTINWEVVPGSQSASAVTFQIVSPDGKLRVRKHYELKPVPKEQAASKDFRDTHPEGYWLALDVGIENLGDEKQSATYTLQGPVGLPLENVENTTKYRDVRMGFLQDGSAESSMTTASKIAEWADADKLEEWKQPLRYIGVDVQYFAALVAPKGDQAELRTVAVAQPMLVKKDKQDVHRSDISVQLRSDVIPLAAQEEVTHSYTLFAGPKRQKLLSGEPFYADEIVDFGWFAKVSVGMLWLMNLMNGWGMPYGIAIIMLTVMVRSGMLPLSMKQAAGAQKMKELQPKIAELRKKYANDKEKMAKAQMELFSKHNYNPFAGCLPIFIQLPIFIGLYRALNGAVDLRMAPFLWMDNLAAPDALFLFPFALPFLGSAFNLLPILTVVLFIVQQKAFMPPPADEQQAMQHKMMQYMMVIFGFLFYKLPAGLCVYFIASSLWGMAERKFLDWKKEHAPPAGEEPPSVDSPSPQKKSEPARPGFWSRLGERIEEAQKKVDSIDSQTKSNGAGDRPKKKDKKSRR